MTDLIVQIDPSDIFDEKDEIKVPPAPKANDFTEDEKKNAWSLLSDRDPETGLKYTWLEIRETLVNDGVDKALPLIFEYYLREAKGFDPYSVYLLACSHFTKEELGDPINKGAKRRLELKIRRLLKKEKNAETNPFKFYREHADELLRDD